MGQHLTKTSNHAVTPLLSKSLGSQELKKHRALVAFELEVLAKKVDRFGWERDRGSPAHDRLLVDWMNALQDYPLDEVQTACIAAVAANPNKMPNEVHVKAQIIAARAKLVAAAPRPVDPEPARVTKDAAADIMAQAGYTPKRMGVEG